MPHVVPSRSPSYRPWRLVAAASAALVATAALAVGVLGFERVVVVGDSMAPELLAGDRLLVCRFCGRRARPLRPGDIAAVADPRQPGRLLVKRAVTIAGGRVWLAGDNSARSTDSRDFGPVPLDSVRGRAVYRYAPAGRAGRLGRSSLAPRNR